MPSQKKIYHPSPIPPVPSGPLPLLSPLDDLLSAIGMERAKVRPFLENVGANTVERAFAILQSQGRLPPGMTLDTFREVYGQL